MMADKKDARLLSGAMKDAVMSLVSRSATALAAERADVERHWSAKPFSSLESYKSVSQQRAALDFLGIANPFFRIHEGRAGATTVIGGREVVNFGSYDYVGLNQDPRVAAAAKSAIDRYGISASASRPTAGDRAVHRDLEGRLAAIYRAEDAVTFVSGHATNVSTIAALMGPKDLVLMDGYIHNSATVGAQLSGAARRSFPHNNLDALERLLSESRAEADNVLIAVEGLYSMDGDLPDLARLLAIKKRFGAWLLVDEAHSLGVLGARGHGIAEHQRIDPREVDIWMGTLSKASAACGGFIAGSAALVEIVRCHAPGFVYSVAMPPALAVAALEAINILDQEPERVARLATNSRHFLEAARRAGLDTGHAAGYAVVPVMVGDSIKAVKLVERLLERGINVVPIIYPAVAMQAARLRFFITSEHTTAQLEAAVSATREEMDRLASEGFNLLSAAAALRSEKGR